MSNCLIDSGHFSLFLVCTTLKRLFKEPLQILAYLSISRGSNLSYLSNSL